MLLCFVMKQDRDAFTKEYAECLVAAGTVDRTEINEAYYGVLLDEPVREHLHGIREFIRRKIDEGVPINWFTGEPLEIIEHNCRLEKHCFDLANGVMRDDKKIVSLATMEELGLSTGQYKRLLRDCVYEGFILMSKCDLNIDDLTAKDIDRVEFNIKSLGSGTFSMEPTFILCGGNTVLKFDHAVVQYEHSVPEYEESDI